MMDILIRLTIPNPVYQFYKGAAGHIQGHTTESLMSEVLSSYARNLSKDVCEKLEQSDSFQENQTE